ncbi:MAG: alpha/beta hydrolase [Sandaracinaceae bacterium]|nr:alpha/beta hydrolase [Sandaracinaceae bacterium]
MVSPWVHRAVVSAGKLRRRRRGPLRAGWSVEVEAWTRVMHHYARRSTWLPLELQRRAIHVMVPPPGQPDDLELEPTRLGGVPCLWIRPRAADPARTLVYLHGGGYSIGSIHSHQDFITRLAREAGVYAVAVDYRLAPEHPYPAALEDARRVWSALLASGVDPARAVIAGESAGGGLTLSTLVALRDAGEPLPSGAALLSPWLDLTLSGASIDANARYDYLPRDVLEVYVRRFLRDVPADHPLVSPLFAEHHGLPPLLVQAGEAEAIVDDSRRFHERARAAGVEAELTVYDDMIHAFMLLTGMPHADRAVRELTRFIAARTDG